MKKSYESNQLIITITFLFLIVSIIFLIYLLRIRYRTYKTIDSVVISDCYLEAIITSEDLKLLKSSNYLYIDNQRKKRRIISVEKNILKRDHQTYHEVIMKVKLSSSKYKENDYVKLTLYNHKERIINIFKSCWKEET